MAFSLNTSESLRRYAEGDPKLGPLYAHFPIPGGTDKPPKGTVPGPVSPATVHAIRDLAGRTGASGSSTTVLDYLDSPETSYVLAGQQPGLFLGPPFALYKLLSAIDLAGRLSGEEAGGKRVIPLFWIASHDSDREEIDHIDLPGPGGEPKRMRFSFETVPPRLQVGDLVVTPGGWKGYLDDLEDVLPPSSFRGPLLEKFKGLVVEDISLAELFARTVHALLPGSGLVLFDGRGAEVDPAGMAIMAEAVRRHDEVADSLTAGTKRVVDILGSAPLDTPEDRPPLFLVDHGVRVPLRREGGRFITPDGTEYVPEDLALSIEEGKVRVTPAAALRPIVQDSMFPNISTIAGQSELVYHAQLGPLYDLLGVCRPPLIPRASMALLHFRSADKLEKLGLSPESLLGGQAAHPESEVQKEIDRCAETLDHEFSALLRLIDSETPGAVPEDDPARTRLPKETVRAMERLSRLADQAGDNRRNLIHRVKQELFPGGRPQEMVTSILYPLCRYGEALLPALQSAVHAGNSLPQILIVDPRKNS